MSDTIQPALTPQQWRDVISGEPLTFLSEGMLQVCDAGDGVKFYMLQCLYPKTFTDEDWQRWTVAEIDSWDSDGLAQLAAVLLNALPDGHRLKPTREDVTALRAMLALDPHDRADNDGDGYYDPRQSAAMQRALSGIERVAAKLAALLPPE